MNDDNEGSLGSLFDSRFTTFITPQVVRVLYILVAFVLMPLGAVIFLAGAALSGDASFLVGALIGVPLWYLFTVLWIRIGCETVLILFRIEKNTRSLR